VNANELVSRLLETPVEEATVRRPPRSKVWVAVYTGATPGKQVWRSTGLTHRLHALAVAKQWEAEVREQRAALRSLLRKPTVRVNRNPAGAGTGQLTQKEVALLLGMSERGVREVERRAFEKLRRHPLLRQIWQQYQRDELDEDQELELTQEEKAALMGLAQTAEERAVIASILRLIQH
jgi:hypothetical protein